MVWADQCIAAQVSSFPSNQRSYIPGFKAPGKRRKGLEKVLDFWNVYASQDPQLGSFRQESGHCFNGLTQLLGQPTACTGLVHRKEMWSLSSGQSQQQHTMWKGRVSTTSLQAFWWHAERNAGTPLVTTELPAEKWTGLWARIHPETYPCRKRPLELKRGFLAR